MSAIVEAPAAEVVEQRLVYRVKEELLPVAQEIVAKVNKKAAKYGLAGYELAVGELKMRPVYKPSLFFAVDGSMELQPGVFQGYYEVELLGEMPRFEGWSFVASLDYSEEGGVITRPVPGVEIDLSAHRARAAECDYCGKKRHRSATYVWRHEDGRMQQVGSTCIVPFAGIKVSGLGWLDGDPFAELRELDPDREESGGGGWGDPRLGVDAVLVATMAVEQDRGWVSRQVANEYGKIATAELVKGWLDPRCKSDREYNEHLRDAADWPAAEVKAAKVKAWAAEQDGDSEWAENLRVLVAGETVTGRNLGLLASAVAGYNRAEGLRIEKAARVAPVFVGSPGEKITLTGEVVHTMRMDGYAYNSPDREMVMIRGEVDGKPALIKWWASRPQGFEIGAKVKGTAKVKKHETYKEEEQTVVTHAKLDAVEE